MRVLPVYRVVNRMSTVCQPASVLNERIIKNTIVQDEPRFISFQVFFRTRDAFPAFLLSVAWEIFGALKGSPANDDSVFDPDIHDLADLPRLPAGRIFERIPQSLSVDLL